MDKLATAEHIRLSQVLEVIGIMIGNPSITQEEACNLVGINQRTFQRWRDRSVDIIADVQHTIQEYDTEELATILAVKNTILPTVLRDALSPLTDPATRLRIYESMTRRQEELTDRVRSLEHNVNPELFNGPELEVKQSRFSSPSVDVSLKDGKFQVTIQTPEIIESVPLRNPEDESEQPLG